MKAGRGVKGPCYIGKDFQARPPKEGLDLIRDLNVKSRVEPQRYLWERPSGWRNQQVLRP